MKYSKISFFTALACLIIQLVRINANINRKLSSAIVWFIQYPLLIISIVAAIIVILNIAGKKNKYKEILLVFPAIAFAVYLIYVVVYTFMK